MPDASDLREVAFALRDRLSEAIESRSPVSDCVDSVPHSAYVTTHDDTLALTNRHYDRLFLVGNQGLGRPASKILGQSLHDTMKNSDLLINGNCSVVDFEHSEALSDGALVELRTIKLPLDGIGHPNFAILGVTQLLRRTNCGVVTRTRTLRNFGNAVRMLDEAHMKTIVLLSKGASLQEIAESSRCSRRTIEKQKKQILDHLGLENTTQLIQLACRLQDAGFGEFGVFEIEWKALS